MANCVRFLITQGKNINHLIEEYDGTNLEFL